MEARGSRSFVVCGGIFENVSDTGWTQLHDACFLAFQCACEDAFHLCIFCVMYMLLFHLCCTYITVRFFVYYEVPLSPLLLMPWLREMVGRHPPALL